MQSAVKSLISRLGFIAQFYRWLRPPWRRKASSGVESPLCQRRAGEPAAFAAPTKPLRLGEAEPATLSALQGFTRDLVDARADIWPLAVLWGPVLMPKGARWRAAQEHGCIDYYDGVQSILMDLYGYALISGLELSSEQKFMD